MSVRIATTQTGTTWRPWCPVMILVSLACAPVSWIDDGVTPSWIAYPVLLLVAGWLVLRGRGPLFLGVVSLLFLIVHLPFTWAALSGSDHSPADPGQASSPVQWLITLFVVPLATSVVGWAAWQQSRATPPPLKAARPHRPYVTAASDPPPPTQQ